MSPLSNGLFGRRCEPEHDHKTWHNQSTYQDHHGYGGALTSKPQVALLSEPVVESHIEWKETNEAHVYKAHLPAGLKRSDVKVEVDDGRVLCIIYEKSVEMEELRDGWHRFEHSSGQFVQRIALPENSNADHAKAHLDNGALIIHVPKHRVVNHTNRLKNIPISHV